MKMRVNMVSPRQAALGRMWTHNMLSPCPGIQSGWNAETGPSRVAFNS